MITPAQRAEIRRLYYGEHWKLGTIAVQLGLHRETVRAAVEHEAGGVGRGVCRPSALDPYLPFIRNTLAQYPRLRATRIHEMVRQRGYTGSVIQVRRLVRRLRPESGRTVYRRVVTLVGEHYVDSRVMLSEADQERVLADRGHLALPVIPTRTRAIRVGPWRAGEAWARPGLGCRHGDVPDAVEVAVKRVATPRPCSVVGQGCIKKEESHPWRSMTGGRVPANPQLGTGQDSGAVAGARRGKRGPGSVSWLVHRDRAAGPGGPDGGGPGRPVWPEGAPPGRADGVARRERGQSGSARRPAGRGAAAAGAERRRRSTAGELRMGRGNRPAGRAHAGRGRGRGVDAAVREHVGPSAGGRDRAGDIEQCGVAAVRGAVDEAPRGVSRAAVGGTGPAGGLH